ncbi:hypothetical protein GR255_27030, partial [Mycobacterium tuberculosis]|nr:hypothetical protein [Mycobacterium tuberculosis]
VAATWQITILAGLLLTPLFGQKIPRKQLGMTLLILLGIVLIQIPYFGRGLGEGVLSAIARAPWTWLLWSTVGFGLFYAPLSMASIYGESWFVAATWQITILAGLLLTPLFGQKIPRKQLGMTL